MSPAKKNAKTKPVKKNLAPARKVSVPKPPAAKPARVQKVATSGNGSGDETVRMVRELAAIVERRALTELVIDTEDMTLTMRRGETAPVAGPTFVTAAPAQMAAPVMEAAPRPAAEAAAAAPAPAPVDDNLHVVTSPFVGTFYRRPNPDADSYTEVGARVEKGQVLCIVEAMKLMNEIEADAAGTVAAILVQDAEPVEYGQPLFKIAPA